MKVVVIWDVYLYLYDMEIKFDMTYDEIKFIQGYINEAYFNTFFGSRS